MTNKTDNIMPKISVIWAMLCRSVSVDQGTNTISLFNILEELTVNKTQLINGNMSSGKLEYFPQKTKINNPFALAVQLERDSLENVNGFEPKMNLKITDPSGEILLDNELPIVFNNNKRMRAVINFDGMFLTKSGKYTYAISTKLSKSDKLKEQSNVYIDVRIFA